LTSGQLATLVDPCAEPPELVFAQPERIPKSMPPRLIKASTDPQSTKPVKVKVAERRRVVHEGHAYTGGDEVTVPEPVAEEWERSRWVERVGSKS
jgi:hypothetical protein